MNDNQNLLPASVDKPRDISEETTSLEAGNLPPDRSMRYIAFGLLYRSYKRNQRRARFVSNGIDRITRIAAAPFKPLAESSLFKPISQQVDRMAERGQRELDKVIRDGQVGEKRSRQVSQQVINTVVGEVVGGIASNPQIKVLIESQVEMIAEESPSNPQMNELVRKLADSYIDYLQEHPEQIQTFVRAQGDNYIVYLNQNPEPVQELVAGQSLSLTSQIIDEVNTRLVTSDSLLEVLARRLFRRAPREELPGPPPEVKAHAAQNRMESDLQGSGASQNE